MTKLKWAKWASGMAVLSLIAAVGISRVPAAMDENPELAGSPAAAAEESREQPAVRQVAKADVAGEEAASTARFVTGLDVRRDEGGTLATIRGDGPLEYEYFLVEGKSLVVDVFNAGNKVWPTVHKVDDAYIEQIRIGEHFQPDRKVRVVFDLKEPGAYTVRKGGDQVAVVFGNPEEAPAAPAAALSPTNTVEEVYFRPLEEKSRIEIKSASEPEYTVVDSEDPLRVIVEVANSRIEPAAQKTLDLSRLNRAVSKITAFQYSRDESPVVRVVIQLREAVPFRVAASGATVAVDVNGLSGPIEQAEEASRPAAGEEPAPAEPMQMAAAVAPQPGVYTGKRLSLDFVDADINDILRLIADVSGLNFVSGPEVKGRITMDLSDVPWDQALEIILKTNVPPLAQIHESDTIIRITTLSKIQEEEEAMRRAAEQMMKNKEAQKKLEPLVTRSYQISYARMENIEKIIREFTSPRVDQDGLLAIDERTNTIIVRDLEENVDEIGRTLDALDAPTPAVVVEARIVEILDDSSKELGVQWNMNFAADAAHGNALPFVFPNSIGLNGGVAGGTVAGEGGAGEGDSGAQYMVNLPASAPTSGIGISFGHIANTLSLDLRLTAMQEMNKVRILSSPRVLVVQNENAKINVGQELPIPSTDAEGNRTVTWREVGINLEVTPQVTNDGKVFMDIRVAKESQGPTVPTTEGLMFSINSRKAETQVLIGDGETAVIGGLAEETDIKGESSTPGLADIPGLGWLFKRKSSSGQNQELMIFLTPKIVKVL